MVTGKRKVGVAKGERRETPATIALGRVHRNGPVSRLRGSSRAKRDRQVAGKTSLFVTSRETNVMSTILRSNLRGVARIVRQRSRAEPINHLNTIARRTCLLANVFERMSSINCLVTTTRYSIYIF